MSKSMSEFLNYFPDEEKVRKAAAKAGGLPVEFADRLKGETFDELVEDAKRLKEQITPTLDDIRRLSPEQIRKHARDLWGEANKVWNPPTRGRT